MDGTVIDKHVNAGDMVSPGQAMVTIYDPRKMQLVAEVRERLGARLQPGGMVRVEVDALSLICQGEIAEVVPMSSAGSHTFEVKVTGPCPPGVRAGMFGRISLPVDEREQTLIPSSAVISIGQLDMVMNVLPDGRLLRRFVQLGARSEEDVEVLAGLESGEQIVADISSLKSNR